VGDSLLYARGCSHVTGTFLLQKGYVSAHRFSAESFSYIAAQCFRWAVISSLMLLLEEVNLLAREKYVLCFGFFLVALE